jgi:hypothetical protein
LEKQIRPYIENCMMEAANILMLSPVDLYKKEAKYSNLYDEDKIEVMPFFGRPEYHFTRTETETQYQLKIFLQNKAISLRGRGCQRVSGCDERSMYDFVSRPISGFRKVKC